jgi:hypothetical protein
VAEVDQFALPAPVSPARVFGGHADDELLDHCCSGRTSRSAARGVVPLPGNQPAMPGQDRGGSDQEYLRPALPWQQPGQGGQPRPIGRCVADSGDLPAQHGVLVA